MMGGGFGNGGLGDVDFGSGPGGLNEMSRSLTAGLNAMSSGMTQMLNDASRVMTSQPSSSGSAGVAAGAAAVQRGRWLPARQPWIRLKLRRCKKTDSDAILNSA